MEDQSISRRNFLRTGLIGLAGLVGVTALGRANANPALGTGEHTGHGGTAAPPAQTGGTGHDAHGLAGTMGEVDTTQFDPLKFLTEFDYGKTSTLPNGQVLREWTVVATDTEVEVAPGVFFPAWAYNGQVPGPTFRCTEGDRLRFHFLNSSAHPHTIHFHGTHPPGMDGVTPVLKTGERFTYEFDARPFGLHLYHCHTAPLARHIHKGLYGTFIIDPPGGRPAAHELVMVMNAFDTNFDKGNEVYAVNTVAFHYAKHPIPVRVGEPIRVYLVNITEFDLLNSFHLHAGMFRLYRTGTRLDHYEYTDTVIMGQGERHILEFTLEYPGQYMFHAHQSEFAELGWMGFFEATA
jgi:FtsP/CotA-like multicopper oxidase with cupredoxin domain